MKKHELFLLSFLLLLIYLGPACSQEQRRPSGEDPTAVGDSSQSGVIVTNNLDLDFSKHKVTFIELGADRCIPCRAMQPIMREIAAEYAGKIQVVFYDVWKDPAPARKYGIQLIPTQVFIDQSGKEIFRHVGFFAKEEMLQMLKEKGIL